MSSLPAAVHAADIDTSRARVHVLRSGPREAPALVLVDGNVSSARFFAETMAALGDHCHCIVPDLRGFGRSQQVPIDARRGLRDFAGSGGGTANPELVRRIAGGGRYTERVLAPCGHSPHLKRPAEFTGIVTRFLAGLDQRARGG